MLRTVIAGHGAELVHPGILHAVVAARLLAVPNDHDLGRTHLCPYSAAAAFRLPIGANLLQGTRPQWAADVMIADIGLDEHGGPSMTGKRGVHRRARRFPQA